MKRHAAACLLSLLLVNSACSAIPSLQIFARQDDPQSMQVLEIPVGTDPKVLISTLDGTFSKLAKGRFRSVEGSLPSPLPHEAGSVMVVRKTIRLVGLGSMEVRELSCDNHLSLVTARQPSDQGVGFQIYGACIQAYRNGYRVTFLGTIATLSWDGHATAGAIKGMEESVAQLVAGMQEHVVGARLVSEGTLNMSARNAPLPLGDEDGKGLLMPGQTVVEDGTLSTPIAMSAYPVACFTPKVGTSYVRPMTRGEAVGSFTNGETIGAIDDPTNANVVQVEIKPGIRGWVPRTEVKRLTCPIG